MCVAYKCVCCFYIFQTLSVQSYRTTDHVEKQYTAEELIRCTKPITIATAKAVAAGNSGLQEDVIVAANMGRKAVADVLKACKVFCPSICHIGAQKIFGIHQKAILPIRKVFFLSKHCK